MARLLVPMDAEKEARVSQFQLTKWIETAPFEDLLDFKIEHVADGEAVLSVLFRVKHANGGGIMHGGVLVSLADTAVAMAIKSVLPEGTHFATTQMEMTFHAPALAGRVKAQARVTGPEGRSFEGAADLYDEEGSRLAHFVCHFRVARGQGFYDETESRSATKE